MTTDELLSLLARDYPNGVSFEPMAMRLLRQKAPVTDSQIDSLKEVMFQLGNGLWVTPDMVSDRETRLAVLEKANEWLMEYGCFSVERLFEVYFGVFCHISTLDDKANFLRHLDFTIAEFKEGRYYCFLPTTTLGNSLIEISETIANWIEEASGNLTFHEIEQGMPQLTPVALESIRKHFLPKIHRVEVGGVTCWRSIDAVPLPEDFSEQLTNIVDKLFELDEKLSVANLQLALNLHYNIRFRVEYHLKDNDTFMRVCKKNYHGNNNVFSHSKKQSIENDHLPGMGNPVRRQHSTFSNIGVPVGAELIFIKDSNITCVVLDGFNQVSYAGKQWTISALATTLLGRVSANGYCYFRYNGEILWERRLRLEREGNQDDCLPTAIQLPVNPREKRTPALQLTLEPQEKESGILGLDGRELAPSTWRVFKCAWKNPRVAEWAQRMENGESAEIIAQECGLKVETVNKYIVNRRQYLLVCEKNGIVPEGDADV